MTERIGDIVVGGHLIGGVYLTKGTLDPAITMAALGDYDTSSDFAGELFGRGRGSMPRARGGHGGHGGHGDHGDHGDHGTDHAAPPSSPPGAGGAAYLAARRAPFAKELAEHPETKRLLGALVDAENPGAGPGVAESLMNRTELVNQARAKRGEPPLTLRDMMVGHPSIGGGKSFYGPMRNGSINSHYGNAEKMYGRIDAALAGSNVVRGYTDQGSAGDPNYERGGVGVNINRERFNNWGYPGSSEFQQRSEREYAAASARAAEAPKPNPFGPMPEGEAAKAAGSSPPVTGEALPGETPRGSANLMNGQYGAPGENLTVITTPSGKHVTVHKDAAPSFQGFLGDLEKSGYKIDDVGGYNDRNIRGSGRKSQHAYGNAIDINPEQNPQHGGTNLPANVSDMAAKWGLSWGGDWSQRSRDPMHFEWSGRRPWLNSDVAQSKKPDSSAEAGKP